MRLLRDNLLVCIKLEKKINKINHTNIIPKLLQNSKKKKKKKIYKTPKQNKNKKKKKKKKTISPETLKHQHHAAYNYTHKL
jgi:hypothetical protein